MTDQLPLSQIYNLGRLGNAGDDVAIYTDQTQRAQIARWSDVLSVDNFEAHIKIKKIGAFRFVLNFEAHIVVTQTCVVTLNPVTAHLERKFERELHYGGAGRHGLEHKEAAIQLSDFAEEEVPEKIDSLYYDLAAPLLEEYVLALEPYPRCPGAEFSPETEADGRSESPFSALRGLKLGP